MSQGLSFYIHIPYCIRRCGYCDFNTYTPSELKGPDIASVSNDYIDAAILEIEMAAQRFGGADVPTIFFGGGTPSLLPARDLGRVVSAIRNNFSIAKDVEVTIEVNPDSVTMDFLSEARSWGATRISMGMQSASPHVLAVLDRTHNPENVTSAVDMARRAGYAHVSVDLIYGSPGESVDDWRQTISSALALDIDHISAYALIVEEGTKFAKKVERGELEMPPEDETAEKYLAIDAALREAGFDWYELSNWAKPGGECRHNINYWNGAQWWGVGPGAHSFIDNRRWWNVKHPGMYKEKILESADPTQGSEIKKTRPCVILSPDEMNNDLQTIVVAPMTSTLRNYPTRVEIRHGNKIGFLVLDQIRTVDRRRIIQQMGSLSLREIYKVKKTLRETFID